MRPVITNEIHVIEGQSGSIVFTLRDEAQALVQTAQLTDITLDLHRWVNGEGVAINGRDTVSILNANGGTFFDTLQTIQDEDGNEVTFNFRWDYTPEDTPFLGDDTAAHQTEVHHANFRWTWADGEKAFGRTVKMIVTNLRRYEPEAAT